MGSTRAGGDADDRDGSRRLWRHYDPPDSGAVRPDDGVSGDVDPLHRPDKNWSTYKASTRPASPPTQAHTGQQWAPVPTPTTRPVAGQVWDFAKKHPRIAAVSVGFVVLMGIASTGDIDTGPAGDESSYSDIYGYDEVDAYDHDYSEHDAPAPGPDALSDAGIARFRTFLVEELGSARVRSVTFDDDGATVLVPDGNADGFDEGYGYTPTVNTFFDAAGASNPNADVAFPFTKVNAEALAAARKAVARRLGVAPRELQVTVSQMKGEAPRAVVSGSGDRESAWVVVDMTGKVTYEDFTKR